MLIVIEGIDGAGKSTLAKALGEVLGINVLKFPIYDSPTGRLISKHLDGSVHLEPNVFQALQTANKMEALPQLMRACNGYVVTALETILGGRAYDEDLPRHLILDRYTLSGQVYGEIDGVKACSWDVLLPAPDMTIVVDVPPEVALERQKARGLLDRYEGNPNLLIKAQKAYLEADQVDVIISGIQSQEETLKEALAAIIDHKILQPRDGTFGFE